METPNRAARKKKRNLDQQRSIPQKGYEYYIAAKDVNQEIARMMSGRDPIKEDNDSLDALAYVTQSLNTMTGRTPNIITSTTSATEALWHAFGVAPSSTTTSTPPTLAPTTPTFTGERTLYEGNVEEKAPRRIMESRAHDLMRCIYLLAFVIQRLTERRIELDGSNLRTLEPFEYRIQMNHLDEQFMFVAQLMDNMTLETKPDWLRMKLTERGLV